jgi:hypothetical protein
MAKVLPRREKSLLTRGKQPGNQPCLGTEDGWPGRYVQPGPRLQNTGCLLISSFQFLDLSRRNWLAQGRGASSKTLPWWHTPRSAYATVGTSDKRLDHDNTMSMRPCTNETSSDNMRLSPAIFHIFLRYGMLVRAGIGIWVFGYIWIQIFHSGRIT